MEERSVKPIKTKIHQGHDPFLDYTPMAEDMQGWGSTDEAFAEVIGQIRPLGKDVQPFIWQRLLLKKVFHETNLRLFA
jgi:hypothetical protein